MKKKIILKKYKDKLLFLSLGGAGQIGINVNLYHYKGNWIMIDCGIGFSNFNTPGADILVSDLNFIKENQQCLVGLILTHAHEDHIGAIPYLIEQLNCPIYASKFTKMMLDEKLKLKKIEKKNFQVIEMEKSFSVGPFQIENFRLNHSIPDNCAIVIKTEIGNVIHTGDWRFDSNPLLGTSQDIESLKYWSKKGVLALVSDSTNSFVKTDQKNELDLRNNLFKHAKNVKGFLVLTTFASNIARLESFFDLARQTNKKVVILGRAIKKLYFLAQKGEFLKNTEDLLISPKNIFKYLRSDILIIATGSQGEPLGATNQIINNYNPYVKLKSGDKFIFSSKIIPGNEKRIFNLINILAIKNIDYFTCEDDFVHSSGHASRKDIITLYNILKPQISVPIHGEPIHIREHYKIAKQLGIPEVIFTQNGKIILLEAHNAGFIGEINLGYYALDGNYLVSTNSKIFQERIALSYNGIISIICILHNNFIDSNIEIKIDSPGLLDPKSDIALIEEIKKIILEFFENRGDKKTLSYSVQEKLKKLIYKFIVKEMQKFPIILINIID